MALGDHFMVVRNGSLFKLSNLAKKAVEMTYQFVGDQVSFLKARDLSKNITANSTSNQVATDKELGRFIKMWIDNSQSDRLSWLGLYKNQSYTYPISYTVEHLGYGNLNSKFNITTYSNSSYINFTESSSAASSLKDHFQWIYLNKSYSANTTLAEIYTMDHSKALHYNYTSIVVGHAYNYFKVVAHSKNGFILHDTWGTEVGLYTKSNGVYIKDLSNLASLINGTSGNKTNSTLWSLSDNCTFFRFNQSFFFKNSSGFFSPMNNPSSFISNIVDDSFTFAISNTGHLHKRNASTNSFASFYTPTPFNNSNSIKLFQNRLFINATNKHSVRIHTYLVSSSNLIPVFNFTRSNFFAAP